MIMVAALIVILLMTSLISFLLWRHKSNPNSPPGPPTYPLLGNLPQLGPVLHLSLTELGQRFGRGVFQFHLMGKRFVVIDKIDLAREVLMQTGSDVADRTSSYVIDALSRDGCSIVFGNYGPAWRLQRKVVHSALRMYGNGIEKLERLVIREANELCDAFASSDGNPLDPKLPIMLSVMNVICALVFGKRYELDDKEFIQIVTNTESLAKLASPENPLHHMPWLRFLPLKVVGKMRATIRQRDEILQRKVDEHKATYRDGAEIRDLTDALLKCLSDATRQDTDARELLTEDHLLMSVNDVFLAGFETTTTALRWILLYIASHPDVQVKIHREIDSIITDGRSPTLQDRKHLPYLEATISEVMRISPIFPLIRRKAIKDMVIEGYDVPKGTFVYVNLWAIHHDENEWESPYEFKPERFLGNDPSRVHSMLPFGAGVRVCVGESLAKMELFLFVSRLLHRFRFSLKNEGAKPDLEGVAMTVYWPKQFEVRAYERNPCN